MPLSVYFTRTVSFVVGWGAAIALILDTAQWFVSHGTESPILSVCVMTAVSLAAALLMAIGVAALISTK
jgi:hypothetical protein